MSGLFNVKAIVKNHIMATLLTRHFKECSCFSLCCVLSQCCKYLKFSLS